LATFLILNVSAVIDDTFVMAATLGTNDFCISVGATDVGLIIASILAALDPHGL
jgi:hypothetical protein